MQYLVMQYVQRYEKDDAGTDKVKMPVPDPSDIIQAGLVNFEDITKELSRIRSDFECEWEKAKYFFVWVFRHSQNFSSALF